MSGLYGMKAIQAVYPFSAPTILQQIRDAGFPAKKVEGIWVSDTDLIEDWRKNEVLKEFGIYSNPPRQGGGNRGKRN